MNFGFAEGHKRDHLQYLYIIFYTIYYYVNGEV